jgi:hypothetical protein
MKSGVELIAEERKRQIEEEGWTAEHDDRHKNGKLALAACCYAAPVPIFRMLETTSQVSFYDPWPWDMSDDKRHRCKASDRGVRAKPEEYTPGERIDLLVKAGALIAAEIDRLLRIRKGGVR